MGLPLASLSSLLLLASLWQFCFGRHSFGLNFLALVALCLGLVFGAAVLREGLRLNRLLSQGMIENLWLEKSVPHPTRQGILMGYFYAPKAEKRLILLHSKGPWKEGQAYTFLYIQKDLEGGVLLEDFPLPLCQSPSGGFLLRDAFALFQILRMLLTVLMLGLLGLFVFAGKIGGRF